MKPMRASLPVAERPRRPEWMKVRAPSPDGRYYDVRKLLHGASLVTVCEEARCPNIGECWGRGTATFQILGDTCTRACRYCYVHSGKHDQPPDPLEPLRLAQAAATMGLTHVVVTSVDRDDLPDTGAGHFAATVRALKAKLPDSSVEVLTPDFLGVEEDALHTVLDARPEVFNHNIETVRRLHRRMRGAKASYDKALWLLRRAKELADYPVLTKSGIIVGLGETNDEVVDTLRDLRASGVDVVTIGQYLQPSSQHATIDRWVHPDEFRWLREQGEALGFGSVFAGPLVRSSYRADEQKHAADTPLPPPPPLPRRGGRGGRPGGGGARPPPPPPQARSYGLRNELTNSRTSGRSTRNTPPVPPHVQLSPNDVTPATTFESPRKFGPPESPKHVPPVLVLFDRTSEPGPVNPVLIWIRWGCETIRTRSATSFHAAASGNAFCSP